MAKQGPVEVVEAVDQAKQKPTNPVGQFALGLDQLGTLRSALKPARAREATQGAAPKAPAPVVQKALAKAAVKNPNAGRALPPTPKKADDVPPPPPPRTPEQSRPLGYDVAPPPPPRSPEVAKVAPQPPVRTVSLPAAVQATVAPTGVVLPPPPPPPPAPKAPIAPVVATVANPARGALLSSINNFKAGALKKVATVEKTGIVGTVVGAAPAAVKPVVAAPVQGAPILTARTLAAEGETKQRAASEPKPMVAGMGINDELLAKLKKRQSAPNGNH